MEECRNAMVEYESHYFALSQVLSQEHVNQTPLLVRDGYFSCLRVFANLVFVLITLVRCELGAKQINSQCFEGIVNMLCSSAGTRSVGGFVVVDSSAPFDKRVLFTEALFIASHDIEHFLV